MSMKKEIAASALLMSTLAAILFVGKEAGGETKPVYAQGEYVQLLSGTASPFADVAQAVMPCVVGVSNRANTYSIISGQTELIEQSTGSGVVITTQGHVVTNYHVVEGASDVQVLWQGQYLKAEIVGVDPLTDLAVLRVMEDVALPAVKMGNAQDVRVGDWAIVIGNPLGKQFADTVTVGVVSALNRELDGTSIVKMLQTDAAINSGNSGGGMFNTRGELIGIPSLKFSSSGRRDMASIEGIAMAIPMDVAQPIVNSLIQYGKVTRPKLGISVMTLRGSEEPREGMLPAGVYVSAVSEGSLAQQAGIQADDIIIRVDGERIMLHTDLTNHIAGKHPGDHVRLSVYRIPGLADLTVQDRIPKGEELEFDIELQAPSETIL
ncbi:MAG: trypsin-like peptidase domain-containing protein [Clostridia bacterium]|nr:trypsin-like peptidase domain-containing protein [Clostridia bacterium]